MLFQRPATTSRRREKLLLVLLVTLVTGTTLCKCSPDETDSQAATPTATTKGTTASTADVEVSYINMLKEWIGKAIDQSSPEFTRKLLKAEVSTDCTFGLLKLVRAIKNLEPWAVRLFDASGKYPTGALQATRSDFGAFDECLETVLLDRDGDVEARGQYCSLLMYARNNSDAEQYILPAIEMAHPKALAEAIIPPAVDFKVKYCTTSVDARMTPAQCLIIAFLALIAFLVVLGTGIDAYTESKAPKCRHNALVRVALCFSLLSNTRSMLSISKDENSDAYRFQFLHGLRFLSIVWIVIGHCYGMPSDVWSRLINNVSLNERWDVVIISAGFISVDTFFFLSAFLLACVVSKQKRVGVVVFIMAVFRRLIRTLVPMFFMIMCMYLLPLIASGPEAPEFFEKLDNEVYGYWWSLLAQVRNYFYRNDDLPLLPHLWYLSLDFQFFVVALLILLICKKRPQLAIALFALLSLVGCSISTWQAASDSKMPFMVVIVESIDVFLDTTYRYYFYPFYHAICYFMGCITFLSLSWFKDKKLSPVRFICKFLSWNAFVPLSRLAFGVYLIHVPFIQLFFHISRERVPLLHYMVVSVVFTALMWSYLLSYLLFVFCEAPTAKLDKLAFEGRRRSQPVPPVSSPAHEAPNCLSSGKPAVIPCVSDAYSAMEAQRFKGTAENGEFLRANGHSGSYHL
ncbi:hypothetical protein HPB50_006968 [Hyalomma asiaticum]|uniref:Uncharacterized protein n=1 Tax=Hyalomma asiaticum TaxID=266040 RepID=A0ACB7TC02_HYAAI|nr:hypothetical protein HPB50_006968 [Hyalomma asiaticum]